MEIERFRESCGACGSRTIHFVIDPPDLRRHCARCGRDNSTTWGFERLPTHQGPAFDRPKPLAIKPRDARPYIKPWEELSSFERSLHFGPGALHE